MTNIAVDIDGVLADYVAVFNNTLRKLYPGRIPADFKLQDFWYTGILNNSELHKVLTATFEIEELWYNLRYLSAADTLASRLCYIESNIYYITNRIDTPSRHNYSALEQTNRWLADRDLLRRNTSVLVIKDARMKKDIFTALDISMSIDDRIDTVQACQEIPNHRAYLYDQSWNRNSDLPRVYSLHEYLDMVSDSSINRDTRASSHTIHK